MSKITFNIDKKQISEGEYVTVTWNCENPDMVTLSVQDGGKSIYQLGDSGTRVVQASGNTDRMVLTLRASLNGKVEEKSITVKVKRKVLKAEKVHRTSSWEGKKKKPFDLGRIKDWWTRFTAALKTGWAYMPETKKLAYKVLGLLMAGMILTSISPKLLPVGILLIGGYLSWIIIKK